MGPVHGTLVWMATPLCAKKSMVWLTHVASFPGTVERAKPVRGFQAHHASCCFMAGASMEYGNGVRGWKQATGVGLFSCAFH